MAGFKEAVETILKHEGGFVNNQHDRGGATNWGITQRVYEAYKGRAVTIDEIKNMPRTDAIAIYKRNYWDTIKGDQIKFYSVALTMFDQAVNRGVGSVIKQAQRVVGLSPDGVLGSKTLASINIMPEPDFISKFLTESVKSYNAIVEKNPSQNVFIAGWLKRVESLRKDAVKWAGTLNKVAVSAAILVAVGLGIGTYFFLKSKRK